MAFAIVVLRLFQVQVLDHNNYVALAEDQYGFYDKVIPERGKIFFKDEHSSELYPAAINRRMNLIYAVPREIEDFKKAAETLAPILEIDEEKLFSVLNKPDDSYEVIKRKTNNELAEKVKELNIKGIKTAPEDWRYYPGDSLAANVLGFVGYKDKDKVGRYGVEGYYQNELAGQTGIIGAKSGGILSKIAKLQSDFKTPRDGDNLVLTIDQTVQFTVEKKLKETIERFGAEAGSAIVMDPLTGAIIAMAQQPFYNPNEYSKTEDLNCFININARGSYEPGSVMKPVTMAMAIDLNKVAPGTTYLDEGVVRIKGWPIYNSDGKAYGRQTMTEVLEKSLNTGIVFVQEQIDKEKFCNYLKDFGFDMPTGVGIEEETAGNLSNLSNFKIDVNFANAAFGQGIMVTPMEMLTAISVIANDGKLMRPYLVEKFIHPDGSETEVSSQVVRQVISPQAANLVSAMMVSVIENGHSCGARVKGYRFAGKTGTAQVAKKDERGYDSDRTIHTFVGFGPLPDSRFAMLIRLDNPTEVPFAADSTAKFFREMMKFLVDYYDIPPEE